MYLKRRKNESARFVGPLTNISSPTTTQMLSVLKRAASEVSAEATEEPSADYKTQIIQR